MKGVVLELETTATPRMTFDLVDLATGEQGLLTRILRPRVRVLVNGVPLVNSAPAGAPEDGFPVGKVLLVAAAAGLGLYLLSR